MPTRFLQHPAKAKPWPQGYTIAVLGVKWAGQSGGAAASDQVNTVLDSLGRMSTPGFVIHDQDSRRIGREDGISLGGASDLRLPEIRSMALACSVFGWNRGRR